MFIHIMKTATSDRQLDRAFLLLIMFGLFLYYIGIVNMYIWVFILFVRLVNCNKTEVGFFCILVGSGIFGRIFALPEFNMLMTVLLLFIGVFMLGNDYISALKKNQHSFLFMFIILAFFFAEFYLGPRNDYAYEKLAKSSIRFIIWTMTFLVFVGTKRISNNRIGIAYLLLAVYYLSQTSQLYGIKPSSLFDMNFYRNYTMMVGRDENDTLVANYHTLAYLSLAGTVFWISQKGFYKKKIKLNTIFLVGLSFWIVAISGARQGIFVFGIITILRYLISKNNFFSVSNTFYAIISVFLFLIIVSVLGSSYFETALDSEGDASTRLHRDTTTPFLVLSVDPILGVGYGGYPIYGYKDYPHNFFLEILCETGIVGLLLLLSILLSFCLLNRNRMYLKYLTKDNFYLSILFILFFFRAQISGDLTTSVSFIAVLLSFVDNRKQIKLKRNVVKN